MRGDMAVAKAPQAPAPEPKIVYQSVPLTVAQGPHNGTPQYQSADPITGAMVGGQIAMIRAALRFKRFIACTGRRVGKTTTRPFLWLEDANLTEGLYTAGFVAPDHTKAWEAFQFVRDQYGGLREKGGMVVKAVGDPQTQDRYLVVAPMRQDPATMPKWYARDPAIAPRLKNVGKNDGLKIYFWSGQHPHYQKIQGFMFKFHRISLDEPAQLHPDILRVINPMLLDSNGNLDVTGIPDYTLPGNVWFKRYFDKGQDLSKRKRWFSVNFPSMANPNLSTEALEEAAEDCLTEEDYEQAILGKFVSGKGAVFGNFDAVFVVKADLGTDATMPEWMRKLQQKAPAPTMDFWLPEPYPSPGHQYALSADWAGKSRSRDATIIGVYDLSAMPKPRQVALFRFKEDNYTQQVEWAAGVKEHYGAVEFHGDENNGNGEAMGDILRDRYATGIVAHKFGAHNKGGYVRRGQFLFYGAEVELIDCTAQRHEFGAYIKIAPESKSGVDQMVRYSHPPGEHDDFVDSFLQVTECLMRGRRQIVTVEAEPRDLIVQDDAGRVQIDTAVMDGDLWEDLESESGAISVGGRRRRGA